jgi:hypothetical protein
LFFRINNLPWARVFPVQRGIRRIRAADNPESEASFPPPTIANTARSPSSYKPLPNRAATFVDQVRPADMDIYFTRSRLNGVGPMRR